MPKLLRGVLLAALTLAGCAAPAASPQAPVAVPDGAPAARADAAAGATYQLDAVKGGSFMMSPRFKVAVSGVNCPGIDNVTGLQHLRPGNHKSGHFVITKHNPPSSILDTWGIPRMGVLVARQPMVVTIHGNDGIRLREYDLVNCFPTGHKVKPDPKHKGGVLETIDISYTDVKVK